ncbi:Secretin receptor [Nymphon striatum]|nr:Secretin receptor [Nymphon striatum]
MKFVPVAYPLYIVRCWILYKHYPVFEWVTRGPTTLFILINFAFFVRIVRVLFIKLRGGDLQRLDGDSYRYSFRGKRYKKLIKSTLILVPLFGAYHIFLVALYSLRQDGRHSHMTFIATVCLRAEELGRYGFGRVGFVVALLYCLLNSEELNIPEQYDHPTLADTFLEILSHSYPGENDGQ